MVGFFFRFFFFFIAYGDRDITSSEKRLINNLYLESEFYFCELISGKMEFLLMGEFISKRKFGKVFSYF